ncbi:MAG: pyridoxamine 5'-phosphate oxidase, partial [Flavobacteriales bacterium]|nr:pyridoxamine 5'-phosphate oxidase [Flavobacteriales bacterium]
MKDFSDYRKNYSKSSLLDHDIVKNPFFLFKSWLKMAEDDSQIDEPNAMTLSTVNDKNEPRSRVVLMKMLKKNGIVFFT